MMIVLLQKKIEEKNIFSTWLFRRLK